VEKNAETLTYAVVTESGEFSRVIQEMRLRAGLSFRELSERMGVSVGAIHQYFYRYRGDKGSSTIKWFLRYARACGCEVTLTFPGGPSERSRDPKTLAEVFADEEAREAVQPDA
jgi:transcriptional regulator with XRE-family HTH domain